MTEEPTQSEVVGAFKPPPYDPVAVGRVAARVEIQNIELLTAHFSRGDDETLPGVPPGDAVPEIGVHVEWALNGPQSQLGCAITFATQFAVQPEPWELIARFRLMYSIANVEDVSEEELNQFAHWNAMFNAWPYWREYLSSTVNRAQLPRFVVPVMGVPRQTTPEPAP